MRMKLFEPGQIGKLRIKNRIVMAPMGIGGLAEPDGRLGKRGIDYYVARAKGGVGLIITGMHSVTREIEVFPGASRGLAADGPMHISHLSELADAVHDYNAKVAVQLTIGWGRVLLKGYLETHGAVAPSPIPCFWDPQIMARELSTKEVERLVKDFLSSADLVRTAGVDAIEIHAHNGYLLDQFQTALWNKRTDKYGGDIEGRLRLSLEIIGGIKQLLGNDFPLIYRFGLTHYLEEARGIEEGLFIVRRLEKAGVDAFHIDAGCFETRYWSSPPETQPPGCMVDLAERVKTVVGVPVIAVGRLGYQNLAEQVLQEGKADFIALGRALLADPEWPEKVRMNRTEDIRPCLGCYRGCRDRVLEGKYVSCAVNPVTGMEREFVIRLAETKKSVLVIGGGPAGMEAARVAALRGHKVTLWEKGRALGGNLLPASAPDFKQDYRSLVEHLTWQLEKVGVSVELNKTATKELIAEKSPDVVIVATGSIPIIPKIPGVKKEKVSGAIDVLLHKKELGKSVVVIGGGLVGCETSLHLAKAGKRLTIVEILDSLARDMPPINALHMLKLIEEAGVTILTETRVLEITDEGLSFIDKTGKKGMLQADSVVLAVGFRPDRELLDSLVGTYKDVKAIGDCVQPRNVMAAIWEGFRTARLV